MSEKMSVTSYLLSALLSYCYVMYECTADQTLTSHALGGLTGSRRTLLSCCIGERRADVKWRHGRHLERMTSYRKSDSVSECIFTWRTSMPFRSDLKRCSLRLLERRPNNNNNNNKNSNKMSCDVRSVADPTIELCVRCCLWWDD